MDNCFSTKKHLHELNSSASLYDYDKDGLLTRLRQLNVANQVVQDRQYQYDQVGNITQINNAYPTGIDTTQTDTINYAYDGSYRLLGANHSNDQYDLIYTYDPVGNRLSKTQAGATQYYSYGIGNRLQSVRVNSITGPVYSQFSYDDNGSLVEKRDGSNNVLLQMAYDQRRLASSITTHSGSGNQNLSFAYDPNAYRIGKQTPQGDKRYYLEAEHLESTYDENNSLLAKYLRGAVIDEVISAHHKNSDNGKLQQRTYHHDQVNSASLLTNHNGETVQQLTYGPFGEPLTASGSDNNALQYTGRELDALTGLYYYRARYYDPELGRFISEDPIGFQGGINFYAYVENNPLIYNDPMGEDINCGVSTCTFTDSNVSTTPFPRPEGFPNNINNDSSFHHFYPGIVPVANDSLSIDQINSALINNPTPAANNNPATAGGSYNDATPGGITSLLVFDNSWPVSSYLLNDINNNIPVVMNVTMPGHPLHPGVVSRYTTGNAGNYIVNNVGEGTAIRESNWNPLAEPIYNSTWANQLNSIFNNPSYQSNAAGGFLIYPNKLNNNFSREVYSK